MPYTSFAMTCMNFLVSCVLVQRAEGRTKGATIRFPGGCWNFFEINNFGRTLREINNLLQELLYINM